MTLLVEIGARLREPLPAADRARMRASALEPPASTRICWPSTNEGLVCLSGCARDGLAVRNPNGAARLAAAFGRDRFFVELQRPIRRGDARRNAALRDLAGTLGVRTVVTGDVHAHHPRRAQLQDVLVAIRSTRPLEGCEAERRGNERVRPRSRPPRWSRASRTIATRVAATVELAERLEFDLTAGARLRYPDFSDGPDPAAVQLARVCARRARRALPARAARPGARGAGCARSSR